MDRERIGKYRILGEIGRGTMGVVYRALDLNPVLNRPVALKTIAVQGGPDAVAATTAILSGMFIMSTAVLLPLLSAMSSMLDPVG